jgi:two-component system sensor histidine kinase VanS
VRKRIRRTIRTRLTLTYTTLMLLFAASVVVTVYLFMRYAATYDFGDTAQAPDTATVVAPAHLVTATPVSTGIVVDSAGDLLGTLLVVSVIALVVLGFAAAGIGWIVTGRMLGPLHEITAATRRVGAGALDHRIALTGPRDELKDLADTFDAMLARLEQAFQSHRRFAANASHELRTPLATVQAVLDVAIADPGSQDVRVLARKLREVNRQSIDVVDALLDLADLDHTSVQREGIELMGLIREAVASVASEAAVASVGFELDLSQECVVWAAATLLRQMLLNLLYNAVRHNVVHGVVKVTTAVHDGAVTLSIRNGGAPVSPDVLPFLAEPFFRIGGRTSHVGRTRGRGLGLAIAAGIATAHGTQLRLTANPGGGLTAEITLPIEADGAHRRAAPGIALRAS